MPQYYIHTGEKLWCRVLMVPWHHFLFVPATTFPKVSHVARMLCRRGRTTPATATATVEESPRGRIPPDPDSLPLFRELQGQQVSDDRSHGERIPINAPLLHHTALTMSGPRRTTSDTQAERQDGLTLACSITI